jgi:pyruvate carboxylase subunit A
VTTNIQFHKSVIGNPHFIRAELTTNFIDDFDIKAEVAAVVEREKEKGATLASALVADDRKVAAITAAVQTYMSGSTQIADN